MSETLIKVDNVSKKFCRSLKRSLWYGLQDLGSEVLGRRHGGDGALRPDEFWAVKDVSFELKRGECLGLIGPNGAGKTTLLRMLNGLIKPDAGRIEMRGRVGALIALGAGFNPILTGRENIYVNASVLGLSKREIDGKIDEIVDFAEIGEFIDSPVQSYSSGMQVRLGFAVATALNPDVLLLDEVLAVGDARFRAKCYEKLSVFLEKSAVVFVSHNMEQIGQICSSVIVMKSGMAFLGCDVGEAINLYDKINSGNVGIIDKHEHVSKGVELIDKNHTEHVDYGGVFTFMCTIMSSKKINNTDVKIDIFNSLGQSVAVSCTKFFNQSIAIDIGVFKYCFSLGPIHLREGYYTASVVLLNSVTNEHIYWGSRTLGFIVRGPRLGAGNFIVPMQVSIADLSG